MRSRFLTSACCALLGTFGLASINAVVAGDVDFDYELDWATGFDSNPLRLAGSPTGAAFTEGAFDLDWDIELRSYDEFFMELEGSAMLFSGDAGNADENGASASFGYKWVPIRDTFTRLTVTGDLSYRAHRETFTSRISGDVFETDDNGTPVPIPERFDSNRLRGAADVEWRLDNRWRFFFDADFTSRDYVEDYTSVSSVEALDYSSFSFEPGVRIQLRYDMAVKMSATYSDRDYDSRSAQDEDGNLVVGTPREYIYTRIEADFDYRPNAPWRFAAGFDLVDREDTFAGYYSYSGWAVHGSTRFLAGARNILRIDGSFRDRAYDNATTSDEIDGEIRASESWTFKSVFTRKLNRRFGITVEAGYRLEDNVNAIYAYDRQWLAAWVTFE